MKEYLFHILVQVCLTSTLAVSLNLLAGYCGLVSLGQLSFFAIGAYLAALLAPATFLGYVAVWPAVLLLAGMAALAQAQMTARLKLDEFAVATFALQVIVWLILMNWVYVTRGPMGIAGIPPMTILGMELIGPTKFFPIALILLATSLVVVRRLRDRPFGFAMSLVKDDEDLAVGFGRDAVAVRRSATIVASLIAASAGVCYASYAGYIHPSSFSSMESALLLAIVIVGGVGTFWGPVIGSLIIVCLPEGLRFVGLPASEAAHGTQIILGCVLILAIFWMRRPRGLRSYALFRSTP
jgi:branched-chain amino acid transport system permease protein